MSKFDNKKIMPRYSLIAILMTLFAAIVLAKTGYLMTVKRDYWMKVADRVKRDSVPTKPTRGNIYSCDGELLAGSLPKYKLYMDFKALREAGNDSLWEASLDSICRGLHQIFPEKGMAGFRKDLEKGREEQGRNWPICRRVQRPRKSFRLISKPHSGRHLRRERHGTRRAGTGV